MMRSEIKDPITVPPTLTGRASKAWEVDCDATRAFHGVAPEEDTTVAIWIIEAPWAHPVWHSYAMVLIHLRPAKGKPPPVIHLPGATHEIWVMALDPEGERLGLIENFDTNRCKYLTPLNFAAQFIMPCDAEAKQKAFDAVERVCDGTLSPDTDYVRHWANIFGSNMLKKGAGETRLILDPGGDAEVQIVIPPVPGPQDLN